MSTLGYSLLDNVNEDDNNKKKLLQQRTAKNRTHKNRTATGSSSKVMSMLNTIKSGEDNPDDGNTLADFNPPPHAISSGMQKMQAKLQQKPTVSTNEDIGVRNIEAFNQMNNADEWTEDYYKQYVPMYTQAATGSSDNSNIELMEKLNYMIHLLEEEREVKNGNVTEEVVLYCFLGVFVIFVVDSFAKVGKYVR